MTRRHRKSIPMTVKIASCLIQIGVSATLAMLLGNATPPRDRRELLSVLMRRLGFAGKIVHWDHRPPLALREFNPKTGLYFPDELDPAYLIPTEEAEHQRLTTGAAHGEGKATYAGSDRHLIDKTKRILRKAAGAVRPKRKIQSRGFAPGKRPLRSRNDFERKRT